jgi:hypothetical protein
MCFTIIKGHFYHLDTVPLQDVQMHFFVYISFKQPNNFRSQGLAALSMTTAVLFAMKIILN